MLGKKLKYDFKSFGLKTIVGIAGTALAAIVSVILFYLAGSMPANLVIMANLMRMLAGLLVFLAFVGPTCIACILLIYRYNQSMAGSESYLTFTLPVKISTHLFANLISAFIYSAYATVFTYINAFVIGLTISALDSSFKIFSVFEFLKEYQLTTTIAIAIPLTMLLSLVQFVLLAYTSISFSTHFSKNKGLAKILGYLVVSQIINLVYALLYWSYVFFAGRAEYSAQNVNGSMAIHSATQLAQLSMGLVLEGTVVKFVLTFVLFFFLARHMYTKKMNIA